MTYQEALSYIHSTHRNPSHRNLSHIKELLSRLGDPQESCRCIHVAGTNGKGSVCAMTDSILRAEGYHVGLFTSPYLIDFRERIQIDGELISEEELASLTEEVKAVADGMEAPPAEFELITAIGFLAFARHHVDAVVLEVGLGGRLDPTNVISSPLISVITGIDFDHTALLGNTIQAIAAEKGGIIKRNRPALWGGNDNSACRTLATVAEVKQAPFFTVDSSQLRVTNRDLEATTFDFGDQKDYKLSLLGNYQPGNAATVLTAMEILNANGFPVSENAIRKGLATTRWQARFEVLSRDPVVLFDGGHNPQGVKAAVKSIRDYFPDEKVNLCSGVMADKDYDAMIELFKPVTHCVYAVAPENPRALAPAEYAFHLKAHGVQALSFDTVSEGLQAALEASKKEGRPLVCLGSLYLYAELSEAFRSTK